MWFLRLLFMTAFHTLSAVSSSLFSYTLLSNTKNTWWGGLDNDRYEEQRGYVIQKHDKTRFETNVQTLWVENTYDFYIDIIRWYFYLRRRNEWKILVMLLVSNFLFRTLIHLVEVKTSCEWFHSSTFLCCINVVNFLIQRSAVGNGKNHSFIYPNRNA